MQAPLLHPLHPHLGQITNFNSASSIFKYSLAIYYKITILVFLCISYRNVRTFDETHCLDASSGISRNLLLLKVIY